MDIDETVLDNSAYQVNLDQTGTRFTPATWDAWVKSEKATLIAKAFIQQVLKMGGKLALVTNRNRHLDHHTWRNLLANGIQVTKANACLMGRVSNKAAMSRPDITNDKDLRRAQVTDGSASCFNPEGKNDQRHSGFGKHQIVVKWVTILKTLPM